MRIIAGTHRGRTLTPPHDQKTTRPITDRGKEALFNRLQSLGVLAPGELGCAADIFCGTGSLGLEALSRGAEHCTFVDHDRDAIGCLRQNLDALGLTDRADVCAIGALSPIWLAPLADGSIGLAFLDPPYAMMADPVDRARLLSLLDPLGPKMEPAGVLVLRTEKDVAAEPVVGWDGPASFTYGSMTLHFYQRPMTE